MSKVGVVEIRTQDYWIRSTDSGSVLCHPQMKLVQKGYLFDLNDLARNIFEPTALTLWHD